VTVDPSNSDAKLRYVISSSGEHAASPEDILASCKALEQHLKKTKTDSDKAIKEWQESISARDLAEKRRVAPGWLDRDEKLLQPINAQSNRHSQSQPSQSLLDSAASDAAAVELPSMAPRNEGEELDRAFGGA